MRLTLRLLSTSMLLALVASASPAAIAQVKVVKTPAVIERRTYDPKHRPTEAPPAKGNEEAVVRARFIVTTQPGYTPGTTKQDKNSGQWTANIRTQQMGLHLALKIEIWAPEGMDAKATAHLGGHRQIVEEVYKTAEKSAARIGEIYVGRGSKGTGETAKAAQQDALKTLMKALADEYLAVTEKRSDRVQEIYDELTGQGAKSELVEADAIKQAFGQQAKEEAEAKKQQKKPAKK